MSNQSETLYLSTNLAERFAAVRQFTETLCETLRPEDCCIQSMPNSSPVRWHLAHTTWFFETFLLKTDSNYRSYDEHYEVLFNSYYNSVGEQFPRALRGMLTRPTVAEVYDYRHEVDRLVTKWFGEGQIDADQQLAKVVELGLHHEQQHQELILTDVKHMFSLNPLRPRFRAGLRPSASDSPAKCEWIHFEEGLYTIGHVGEGFAYDNEGPQHRVFLEPYALASRPVTSGEFLEFISEGGYSRPEFWLSEGWQQVQVNGWHHPLYWYEQDGRWQEFTLSGSRPVDLAAPVTHVSFFEADAFSRWAGVRLPTEAEWEVAAQDVGITGNFADTLLCSGHAIHPSSRSVDDGRLAQMFGDIWEWTASQYTAYPGYQPAPGALGEYNGKFMCNQFVLRGGSCATSSNHIRRTYRNFFAPEARWQFSGFRLAK
ncbi:ergothioneine biosynthesis protein EgtB [Bythopirellula polymerisocia]|uniref:Iron(II)-dependent oxidoreductase EgtB n=1 Tax=Bythopirellula polymerisocia TaxID=2528003 RepID=A0A5C6CWH0_9BACT|nr:ergothioneine biosynthesis protein EgtB [Bythopirellula polymerisocia]TWU27761.1 Iron(II)-dependent oxidoreductase EgtB [Bythopirellula polymerisocia]